MRCGRTNGIRTAVLRKQIADRHPQRREHGIDWASGMAFHQRATVRAFANAKTRLVVFVRRAMRHPAFTAAFRAKSKNKTQNNRT
jgi:hypothetical protein